jgi:nicotinamidase/pyrazinamidase
MKRALLVVDVQRDFCPGGALPVRQGDAIIRPLNGVIQKFETENLPIVFTRDWHPANHISFKAQGGIWPPHCVKNTMGAEFHPDLRIPKTAVIVSKATEPRQEAYSGFEGTDLANILRRSGAEEVLIGGLATDYCVLNTALDAVENGFRATVISDCVRGVNVKRTDSAIAFRKMLSGGVGVISSSMLISPLEEKK